MALVEAPQRSQQERKAADCRHRRARRALWQPARHLAGGARAARPHHDLDQEPAAGRGGVSAGHRGGAGDRAAVRGAPRAGDRVRHRHVARRPGQCAARRHLPRFPRHEPRARGPCRGSRLRHRAGHHPQSAQRAAARQRAVFSDRSRRRCLARRHGGDACVRHQCGALRHHEGQCAGAQSRARQRRSHVDRRAAPRNPPPATT